MSVAQVRVSVAGPEGVEARGGRGEAVLGLPHGLSAHSTPPLLAGLALAKESSRQGWTAVAVAAAAGLFLPPARIPSDGGAARHLVSVGGLSLSAGGVPSSRSQERFSISLCAPGRLQRPPCPGQPVRACVGACERVCGVPGVWGGFHFVSCCCFSL